MEHTKIWKQKMTFEILLFNKGQLSLITSLGLVMDYTTIVGERKKKNLFELVSA